MKEKAGSHGFSCVIRIGASGSNTEVMLRGLLSSLRMAESSGIHISTIPVNSVSLDTAKRSWHFPLQLSVKELLSFLCWPLGDEELAGIGGLNPRTLLPPDWYSPDKSSTAVNRIFAKAADDSPLSISARDALEHTVLLGPTGSGKSTAMLNLILADIAANRSVLVIDPKADLVHDVLARIPDNRQNDVVVLDPSDHCPVGLNPLASGKDANLTADTVLATLRGIFSDSWGVRMQDVLSGALLTLTRVKGATLLWLPTLLLNDNFRHKIIKNVAASDPIGLGTFWSEYEAMSARERHQTIAPVLNKLRQFLLRPHLRAVLGQAESKFNLADIFSKRRIVLVPLNRGMIGSENARLLGSLIVGQLWTLALGRAAIPPERRHIVNLFIDEVQDYLHLPTDLSDALSQARGLGLGLTVAHQYRAQLPSELKAGIDANCRNKIVFGLNATDARDIAAMAPELEVKDIMLQPRYGIYTSFQHGGKNVGWISGQTLSPPPVLRDAYEFKAMSMANYGRDIAEIEQEYMEVLGLANNNNTADLPDNDAPIGRKKRSEP
jgi:hypothetical protein